MGTVPELDEIVVTASMRREKLEDIPYSIQALNGSALANRDATDFGDYLNTVSGVSFTDTGTSGTKITMRGLATSVLTETQSTSSIYLDNAPVTDPGGAAPAFLSAFDLELVDIDRIEVLKGPQGTLYGAESLGGTIRIITNQPNLDQFESVLQADLSATQHGGFNHEESGIINLPLVRGTLALRAVLYNFDTDGYIDDPLLNKSKINTEVTRGGRVSLLWDPSESLSVEAHVVHQQRNVGGLSGVGGLKPIDPNSLALYHPIGDGSTDETWLYNAVIHYQFPSFTLTSSTAYLDRPLDVAVDVTNELPSLQGLQLHSDTGAKDTTEELRAVSTLAGPLQWLAGLYYFHEKRDFLQTYSSIPTFPSPLYDGVQDTRFREVAAFGQVTYNLTSRFKVSAGVRRFRDTIDGSQSASGLFAGIPSASGSAGAKNGVVPRVNLAYKLDAQKMLYATASEGFRRGGINASAPQSLCGADLAADGFPNGNPTTFNPDHLWNYELGTRTRWWQGLLAIDASVYRMNWSDLPIAVVLPCNYTFYLNAGAARIYGGETEVHLDPAPGLDIAGTYTYTDSKLETNVPATGARAGDRAPGVPLSKFSLITTYTFPLGAEASGYLSADVEHVGSSLEDYRSAPLGKYQISAYTLADADLGVHVRDWKASLYVKNLTNTRDQLFRYDPLNILVIGRPRTVGATIERSFY